jgi:uncharacterized protein YjbI with pentapeptide repeats
VYLAASAALEAAEPLQRRQDLPGQPWRAATCTKFRLVSPQVVAAVIAASISFLTLVGTLAAQYFGRRATSRDTEKALDRTLAEQREQLDRTLAEQRARTLNERFATAASQLGDDKPAAVRLAGVYAMAGLADDWEENRQTCVDVPCAYLRMPYEPDPAEEGPEAKRLSFRAIREIRHTVIRVITAHLQKDAVASWQGLNFDFTGVVFDGGDFSRAQFSGGRVDFSLAQFSGGSLYFSGAQFSGGSLYFSGAQFSGGALYFHGAQFSGGSVYFHGALFSGGSVYFNDAQFSCAEAYFTVAQFSSAVVNFSRAQFSGGEVNFSLAQFSGGAVSFSGAQFSAGEVYFGGAQFSGGAVNFSLAQFSGGSLYFSGAQFSGAEVYFHGALFSGGTLDFSDAGDWSSPPAFPWTDTPPSGVKLPQKRDQSQA